MTMNIKYGRIARAAMAICLAAQSVAGLADGYDRVDVMTPDGMMTSMLADSVSDITFKKLLSQYNRMCITTKGGDKQYLKLSDFSDVRFAPVDHTTSFPIEYNVDYNIAFAIGKTDAVCGEECGFRSSHHSIPSGVHVYGDYTGVDYNAIPGFMVQTDEPDAGGMAGFSFKMPFEPVNIRIREWQRTLYNGIAMPEVWPPTDMNHSSYAPMPVPYLQNIPEVIDISVGRQLFVDDFLIESTDLTRVFHKPVKHEANPVLSAVITDMTTNVPGATPKDGGVWWEPRENRYKMWYEAGWYGKMALAVSDDGMAWTRPDVGNGSNILPSLSGVKCNSSSVVLDYDAPDGERYKLFMRSPNATATDFRGWAFTSADGINWENKTATGLCGDRSTMFYNPFRKRWVYSIRSVYLEKEPYGRARYYYEHPDFIAGAQWGDDEPVFWCQGDGDDERDPEFGRATQLYNLNAVAYESIMLGMHQILMDENDVATAAKRPKITELKIGFSRDGFHWDRPYRDVFIPASRTAGTWDRGYIQSVGGICGVYGDELRFYYIGFAGGSESVMHSNGATGVAVMRRDGFASMETDGSGTLTTRLMQSDAPAYLWVNADCPAGSLRVEILDKDGNALGDCTAANCTPLSADSTIQSVSWGAKGSDLSDVLAPGMPFRLRFHLSNGKLYSFWLSPTEKGESRGYVGAGGPGYDSNVDSKGVDAYNVVSAH